MPAAFSTTAFPDVSPRLALPLILPDQAQKHVSHNEAIDRLDLLVQLVVEAFGAETPPAAPAEGAVWALGPAPVGAWAGQAGRLASWRNGAWLFLAPGPGWRGWDRAGGALRGFDGANWVPLQPVPESVERLGINAAADGVNRLAVAAPATLFSHEGAGHQLKVNKAAATDTASLLFQTGWSCRAEMGLTGSDDFAIRVSADGETFTSGLGIAAATGRVTAPAGLHLANGAAAAPALGFAADPDTGLIRAGANQIGLVTGGVQRALLSTAALQLSVPLTGAAVQQGAGDVTPGRLMRADYGYSRGNILGSVAQSAGQPTGAVIERGATAEGEYLRLADGTQICWGGGAASLAITTALAGGVRSAEMVLGFPVVFAAAPKVTAQCEALSALGVVLSGVTPGAVTLCFTAASAQAAAERNASYIAVGRWI